MHPQKRVPSYTRDLMSTHFAVHCSFGINHLAGILYFLLCGCCLTTHLVSLLSSCPFSFFSVSISLKYSVSLLRLKWSIHPRLSFVVLHIFWITVSAFGSWSAIFYSSNRLFCLEDGKTNNAFLKCIIWFFFFAIDDIQRSTTLLHLKLWT